MFNNDATKRFEFFNKIIGGFKALVERSLFSKS